MVVWGSRSEMDAGGCARRVKLDLIASPTSWSSRDHLTTILCFSLPLLNLQHPDIDAPSRHDKYPIFFLFRGSSAMSN
ncbi:hypothetical protein IG631_18868 [Alternaria alternata]|nr:hypothetical protein IG631_18868 [Alternaria alternata]